MDETGPFDHRASSTTPKVSLMTAIPKFLLAWLVFFLAFLGLSRLAVWWDLLVHPWVRTAIEQWSWYNYFTSGHTNTVLFLLHFNVWVTVVALFSGLVAALSLRD